MPGGPDSGLWANVGHPLVSALICYVPGQSHTNDINYIHKQTESDTVDCQSWHRTGLSGKNLWSD